jgi:protoporphyrinogen oxidase
LHESTISGIPYFMDVDRVFQRWPDELGHYFQPCQCGRPRSMAQYTVGHPQRLAEIQARTPSAAGLHLAGNAYEGIGIPDCIRLGRQAAARILIRGQAT